eukprot:6184633-Pleurochrysis_carterae.AAC.2
MRRTDTFLRPAGSDLPQRTFLSAAEIRAVPDAELYHQRQIGGAKGRVQTTAHSHLSRAKAPF